MNPDGVPRDLPTGTQLHHTYRMSFWVYDIVSSETILLKNCALLGFHLGILVAFIPGMYGVLCFSVLVLLWRVLILGDPIMF